MAADETAAGEFTIHDLRFGGLRWPGVAESAQRPRAQRREASGRDGKKREIHGEGRCQVWRSAGLFAAVRCEEHGVRDGEAKRG